MTMLQRIFDADIERALHEAAVALIAAERRMQNKPPAICYAPVRRGNGCGGWKLSRKRLIKKWMKIRPATAFPKGAISYKQLRVHRSVFHMYYPDKYDDGFHTRENIDWHAFLCKQAEGVAK